MEERKYRFLDGIDSPADLKGLAVADLEVLCAEVRDYMVRCCAENPGHLASSLGAVEIITALHYVYDTPADKIVFDVGHQAYAHKILTGRREAFRTNRTKDGISGFPVRSESPYDAFGVGHASTSVSAALGLAEAARLRGSGEKTVAVIGDGALTGGLAFEGLNNAGGGSADLLVLINDNNQSIDKNLGGLHNHLLSLTTSPFYNRVKDKVWRTLGESRTRNFFQRWIRTTKSWIVGRSGGDLFESLGFRYFGPIDGNDIGEVVDALRRIRGLKGPRVLHCLTTKGHGYAAAEADPTTWHAPGRFDPETGQRKVTSYGRDRYQDVFGEVLLELARADARVVGITPAMASGCGMNRLAAAMPERFFDVGIEEEHAVTFAAGLAAAGIRPFCNIYSAFSQRAYDQLVHDVALQRLPVVLCLDRAGLVAADGATHQGAFDLAAFRSSPNCTLVAPRDEYELKCAMHAALRSAE
ncbi:MAG: 1-deoxy-D-xylulose-5-phosphate synthase, partial [Bacteroidales bacterium]|nr:1-deoxy-D-xylulose-5-phosphate synthase [Bacteroidales bacterium]